MRVDLAGAMSLSKITIKKNAFTCRGKRDPTAKKQMTSLKVFVLSCRQLAIAISVCWIRSGLCVKRYRSLITFLCSCPPSGTSGKDTGCLAFSSTWRLTESRFWISRGLRWLLLEGPGIFRVRCGLSCGVLFAVGREAYLQISSSSALEPI